MTKKDSSVAAQSQVSSLTVNRRVHEILAVTDVDDAVFSYASDSYYSSGSSTSSRSSRSSDDEGNSESIRSEKDLYDVEEASTPLQTDNRLMVSLPSSRKECAPIASIIIEEGAQGRHTVEKSPSWIRWLLWLLCILILLVSGATLYFVFKGRGN